ncbi:MAG: DUF2934 domain-containing protein [Phycisphaerae bacterium]|nr:DUF2934 domain-containing protein [Phycisphaerae bacterium]
MADADTATGTPERTEPTHDQIARRAYEIYSARDGRPGSPESDWAQALQELTSEAALEQAALPARRAGRS